MAETQYFGLPIIDTSPEKAHDPLPQIRDFQVAVDDALHVITGGGAGDVALGDPGGNGIVVRVALGVTEFRELIEPSAGLSISNNDGILGNPTFTLTDDLAALEALTGTGFAKRTGSNAWALAALVLGDIPDLSSLYQSLDADLTAIAALVGTSGLLRKTGTNAWTLDTATYATQIYVDTSIGVVTTRTLTAGAGLTGGGDLSASRIFDVGAGIGITVNADNVALDTTNTRNVDHTGVTLTAGAGLTGGGDIAASRTLDVGAGTGITVNADDVALNTSSTRNTDHASVTLTAGAGLTGGGDITANRTFAVNMGASFVWTASHTFQFNLTARTILPELTDSYDLGSATLLWRKGWLSELDAVLFAENTISVIGGWLLVAKGEGTVDEDIDISETQIDFGTNNISANDFIIFRAAGQVEYMQATSLVSGNNWNVTRNLDGSGANAWPQGSVWVNFGYSGTGRIELNANDTPRISILTQGTSYNAQTELLRMGDLNGWSDYSSVSYGFVAGSPSASNITIDPTNGIRIRFGTTNKIALDASGNASFAGTITSTSGTIGNWSITSTGFTRNEVTIAAGVDISNPASGSSGAWFGKSAAGYVGVDFRKNTAGVVSSISSVAGNSTLRPYFSLHDGANYRVIIGELNNVWNSGDSASNSIGMKVYSSTGVGLVEFSDVQNIISGFTVGVDYLRDNADSFGLASTVTGGDDVRFWAGNTFVNRAIAAFRLTGAGNLFASNATITGAVTMTSGSINGPLTMSGASSSIAIGVTPPTSATTGTGLWQDRSGLFALTADVQQATLTAAGITAGTVILNSAGLALTAFGTAGAPEQVKWNNSGSVVAAISGTWDSTNNLAGLVLVSTGKSVSHSAITELQANQSVGGNVVKFSLLYNYPGAGPGGYAALTANSSNLLGLIIGSLAPPNAMLDVRGDAVITGILKTGSVPTILTDSTGKILSTALDTVGVGQGGTGTATAFTIGSIVFAGASGIYTQNNAHLFWDNTNNKLKITGPASSSTASPDIRLMYDSDADAAFSFLAYAHDNIALAFDAYFNGSNWTSSHSGSNFAIYKTGDELFIGYNAGTPKASTFASFGSVGAAFNKSGAMRLGNPTGGYKTAGSLNAVAVYDDNVLLTDWVFDLHFDGKARAIPKKPIKGKSQSAQEFKRIEDEHLVEVARLVPTKPYHKLFSLTNVRNHVSANRRLPWMPAKEEFEQERHIGGMISRLWQGQEQTMLYVFELEQEIEELKKQLAS